MKGSWEMHTQLSQNASTKSVILET